MITENAVTALAQLDGHIFQVLVMLDTYLTPQKQTWQWLLGLVVEQMLRMMRNIHSLQGRMLHLLPSTVKKEKIDSSDDGGPGSSSYKRQKDAKSKASSSRFVV